MVKVQTLYDFTTCDLPAPLFDIRIPREKIEEKIRKAAEHFLTIEETTGPIQNGDIVAVKTESTDPLLDCDCSRFCVGKGFFDPAVDGAVIGKKAGDVISVLSGDTPVTVTVLWAKRRMVPEFTDEMAAQMAARMELEDVTDVAGYRDYVTDELVNEDKEKKQNAIWQMVRKKLLSESLFEADDAEVDAQYKKDLAYMQEELEDDFEEYMQVKYHGKTLEENKKNFRTEIENTMKLVAIAAPMAKEDGMEWTRDEYDAVIDDMVSEDYTREELEQSMSYEDYVRQQMEAYLEGKVLAYFDDRFTVTIL